MRSSLHELNNVLAIIHSSAELMQTDSGAGTCASDVENIIQACRRGMALVQEVREAALEKRLELE